MKRVLALAIIFVLAVSMCFASYAAPAVDGRKTTTAYVANISIDGKIDEAWNYAPINVVDTVKENASSWYGDSSKVSGVDYATCQVRVLWDGSSTIYLLYEIKDAKISSAGANPWEQDSVEFFFQADNEAEDSSAGLTQVRLFTDPDNDQEYYVQDYELVVDGSDILLEVAYDISFDASNGNYMGIDFQYNDDAEGNGVRNVCLGWSDSIDKASSDCTVYGQCEMSTTTVDELIAAAAAEAADAEAADAAEEVVVAPATADVLVSVIAVMAVAAGAVVKSKR